MLEIYCEHTPEILFDSASVTLSNASVNIFADFNELEDLGLQIKESDSIFKLTINIRDSRYNDASLQLSLLI